MHKNTSKIAYLDGIRGLASLLVFVHHFLLAFYFSYYSFDVGTSHINGLDVAFGRSIFSVFANGHFFVCVFFVLSGFVLSRKYFQTNSTEVLVSAAMRRFLRLYIPVAVTMILSFVLLRAGQYYNVPAASITHSEWFGKLWDIPDPLSRLWYCLRTGTMFKGDNIFDTSLWTMSIEFTGSMMVFAFLSLTHNTRHRSLSLTVLLLYCVFAYDNNMVAFALGIGLNYVEQWRMEKPKHPVHVTATALLFGGLILGSFPSTFNITGTVYERLPALLLRGKGWAHVFGAWFVVLAFVLSGPLQRLGSSKPFRFLGYISFSLYLLHPLVIGSFSALMLLRLGVAYSYNQAALGIFLLTLVLCLVLSWLMTKYVDEPGTRFSRYVYDKWFRNDTNKKSLPAGE